MRTANPCGLSGRPLFMVTLVDGPDYRLGYRYWPISRHSECFCPRYRSGGVGTDSVLVLDDADRVPRFDCPSSVQIDTGFESRIAAGRRLSECSALQDCAASSTHMGGN